MGTLWIPTGQVFGSNTSPQNFESAANARELVAEFLSNAQHENLIEKHKNIIQKVTFDNTKKNTTLEKAVADKLNPGVFKDDGSPVNTPHFTFVDDNHMVDVHDRIKQAMAASIEAIFLVFGEDAPNSTRRSALSLEKYFKAICSWKKIQLGNLVDTRRMVVSHPDEKIEKIKLQLQHWHKHRRSFTLKQGAQLLGNLEHLASWCPWLRFTAFSLRDSLLTALRANRQIVFENEKVTIFISDSKYPGHNWQRLLKKNFATSKLASLCR